MPRQRKINKIKFFSIKTILFSLKTGKQNSKKETSILRDVRKETVSKRTRP
jgi:hypothetical protein